jgi:hypothetical protein
LKKSSGCYLIICHSFPRLKFKPTIGAVRD